MNELEQELRRNIRAHNRQCWLGALAALFFAWFAWIFIYGLLGALILLFETIRFGEFAAFPKWLNPAFAVFVVLLLVVGGIGRWRKRFRPPPDRPVIGWHLVPETLFLPATLTFSIGEHLEARIRFSSHLIAEAARLLSVIFRNRRAAISNLGFDFSDARELQKLLAALQLLGWIDLHRSDDEWFYLIRSDHVESLAVFLQEAPPSET